MAIHLAKKVEKLFLFIKKIKIAAKYLDFLNSFLEKKTLILLELIKFNWHAIKLLNSK